MTNLAVLYVQTAFLNAATTAYDLLNDRSLIHYFNYVGACCRSQHRMMTCSSSHGELSSQIPLGIIAAVYPPDPDTGAQQVSRG
jgi:hypothetical protein